MKFRNPDMGEVYIGIVDPMDRYICSITRKSGKSKDKCKLEEANMDKPLKDWTLGECKAWCEKSGGECPERCPIERICDLLEQSPAMLDLDEKPRFTDQEVERAKAIKVLWPETNAIKSDGAWTILLVVEDDTSWQRETVPESFFPSAEKNEVYTIDEIIGGSK